MNLIFNNIIILLYIGWAVRGMVEHKLGDICYGLSAAMITATVTYLYKV